MFQAFKVCFIAPVLPSPFRLVWEYCEHIKLAPDELGLMTVDLDDGERIITLDEAVITELEGEPLIELLHSLGLLEKVFSSVFYLLTVYMKFVVDNDEEDNELYAVGFKKCEICEFFGEVNAHVRWLQNIAFTSFRSLLLAAFKKVGNCLLFCN